MGVVEAEDVLLEVISMARTVKRKDGSTRREGHTRASRGSPGFVELVSSSAEASTGEAVCEIVLVSGRRLMVREGIQEDRLRGIVRALEQGC